MLSIYFATIGEQTMDGWRPFPNYLHAISDWYLKRLRDPLEITARKVRSFYEESEDGRFAFAKAMRDAIYGVDADFNQRDLLRGNGTLRGVVELCAARHGGRHGVSSVVSYNYDNLLELGLRRRRPVSVIDAPSCSIAEDCLPIFHVHGFVPFSRDPDETALGSREIVFSEEEYNLAASDPYAWSNLVQLREMSGNVGLMVGLSLADRNIRRLLDALVRSPVRPRLYALLKKPTSVRVEDAEIEEIDTTARALLDNMQRSGIKNRLGGGGSSGFDREAPVSGLRQDMIKAHRRSPVGVKAPSRLHYEVRGIIEQVEILERERQEIVMRKLGITPIWYGDHDEIEGMLLSIAR